RAPGPQQGEDGGDDVPAVVGGRPAAGLGGRDQVLDVGPLEVGQVGGIARPAHPAYGIHRRPLPTPPTRAFSTASQVMALVSISKANAIIVCRPFSRKGFAILHKFKTVHLLETQVDRPQPCMSTIRK